MTARRDDAAYKRQYREMRKDSEALTSPVIGFMIRQMQRNTMPVYPDRSEARIDAATDILMERGLCSSVLSWHARSTPPRYAEDDLPW